tara:strand:+ start:266 stop:472 length:207 start_codon:yes stop_codon:yes gene_type:complete
MMSPITRKWFWGALVGLNTLMILFNAQLAMYDWAVVNFLSALGCWVGFFIAERDLNKEKENGDERSGS